VKIIIIELMAYYQSRPTSYRSINFEIGLEALANSRALGLATHKIVDRRAES